MPDIDFQSLTLEELVAMEHAIEIELKRRQFAPPKGQIPRPAALQIIFFSLELASLSRELKRLARVVPDGKLP